MHDETETTVERPGVTRTAIKLTATATELTARIAAAFLSHNAVALADLPGIIRCIHSALIGTCAQAAEPTAQKLVPAVSVKRSITPDYIICLEDGKKLKMLKRHLASTYGLTPDAYRVKWGLPPDYPMTASNYAAQRSVFAKAQGLGRQPSKVAVEVAPDKGPPGAPRNLRCSRAIRELLPIGFLAHFSPGPGWPSGRPSGSQQGPTMKRRAAGRTRRGGTEST